MKNEKPELILFVVFLSFYDCYLVSTDNNAQPQCKDDENCMASRATRTRDVNKKLLFILI